MTTSIGRPAYPSLAPFVVVEDDVLPTISVGNPDLKPYKAVEFRRARSNIIRRPTACSPAGIFHKEIDDPIYPGTSRETNVTLGGVTLSDGRCRPADQRRQREMTGVEFNVQTQFTFLPGVLSGFGVSANYTHVWGHATGLGGRRAICRSASSRATSGNVQIFYEKVRHRRAPRVQLSLVLSRRARPDLGERATSSPTATASLTCT